MSSADLKANRPLSPHVWIYRWPLTMVMSIAHRITGAGLYIGTALVVWWLWAAASPDPRDYDSLRAFFGSWLGLVILFGYTWALLHHMLGGVRHLIWDTGALLTKTPRNFLAMATVIGSATLTIVIWVAVLAARS